MGKVFTDIVNVFKKNGNVVTRLILTNVLLFFTFSLVKFSIGLFPGLSITPAAIDINYLVSQNWSTFITHPWALIFHAFNHEGLFAMIFDLLIIYWFGNLLADFIGGQKMFFTYWCGALFAVAFFMLVWGVFSAINPKLVSANYLFGASAGAYALMYAYVALNPDSEVMFFTLRIKTRVLILLFLLVSIYRNPALGVLDLGGAFFGYLHIKLLRSGINLTSGFERITFWFSERLKAKPKKVARKSSENVIPFKPNYEAVPSEEELNYLLDKINKEGYENLTKEEKQRLHKASQSAD